jgi:sec-independent protein translocase protein TatC
MTLTEHLEELRQRLIKSLIAVAVATVLSFFFIEPIMGILVRLSGGHKIVALSPAETFMTTMKVALFTGVALSMPILIYQMFRFLAPGLTKEERKLIMTAVPFVFAFFLAGLAFGYLVLIPAALQFLLGFGTPYVENQLRISEFLSFVSTFLLAIGGMFETPVVIFSVVKLRLVSRKRLANYRKYVFLLSFVLGAIITPTGDPLNMTLLAVPIYLLYELGLLLARFAR